MDNAVKQQIRSRISDYPLWDKASDNLAVLFPNAIKAIWGVAVHARIIFWYLTTFNRVIIQLPRRHGKSTYVTFMYVMWLILTRRKQYILIVSSTNLQAVKFLARIKYYLESKIIREIYGDLGASRQIVKDTGIEEYDYVETDEGKKRSSTWNFKEVVIEPWDIRIMSTSIKSANRGLLNIDWRPDEIILDDVEDRKNTNTETLRAELIQTLFEEIIPAGSDDCHFVAIGTICHHGSYLLQIRNSPNWKLVPFTRATDTIENIKKINDELPEDFPYKLDPKPEILLQNVEGLDGTLYKRGQPAPEVALWQPRYSYLHFCKERLDYKSVHIENSFWQEHYNIAKGTNLEVFEKWRFIEEKLLVKHWGGNTFLLSEGHSFPNNKNAINVYGFIGGDLAISTKTNADYRAFVYGFTDAFENVYVFPPIENKEPNPFKLGQLVVDLNDKFLFRSATFDGQNFQEWFAAILKKIISEKRPDGVSHRNLTVYEEKRYGLQKKEEYIIGVCSPVLTTDKVFLCGERSKFQRLINQFKNLGYDVNDDLCDAFTYFVKNLQYPALISYATNKSANKRDNEPEIHEMENAWYLC